MEKIIIGAIIVGAFIIGLFAYKDSKKKQEKNNARPLPNISRKGSIIFYSILAAFFLFFFIMYIMWKSQS